MKTTLLIVEDDTSLRSSLEKIFSRRGYQVFAVGKAKDAINLLKEYSICIMLLDIQLPDDSGMAVLSQACSIDEEILVIMITAFPEIKTAVQAMKVGAYDFVIKPFELEELYLTVERAKQTRSLRRDVKRLERQYINQTENKDILGESSAIKELKNKISKVAQTNTPVLIVGETGSGKELISNAVHYSSDRSNGPLVKVNCSAFSEALLESELFGHEKGAFTDAKTAHIGLFEMADEGTLFLDEISEMKLPLQAKLLRIVEGHPFRRLGGQREISTQVRVIAATNQDLLAKVKNKEFREDLYFRLNVFRIDVPPLRIREADVILLANFFLKNFAKILAKGALNLHSDTERLLLSYNWPGNVRELRNIIERAVILCEENVIGIELLPSELHVSAFTSKEYKNESEKLVSLDEMEHQYMLHVFQSVKGNISEAARILGISRNTLKTRLRISF